jgi:hypothetical protein
MLGDWQTTIPTPKGDVTTTSLRFAVGVMFSTTRINFPSLGTGVSNVTIANYLYEDNRLLHPEQQAIVDLRLTLLGRLLEVGSHRVPGDTVASCGDDPRQRAVARYASLLGAFEELLAAAQTEEDLQAFLEENHILLGPMSDLIPKQKLGTEYVTDFVMVNAMPQGPEYTFVEIEAPSKRLFTKKGNPSSDLHTRCARLWTGELGLTNTSRISGRSCQGWSRPGI